MRIKLTKNFSHTPKLIKTNLAICTVQRIVSSLNSCELYNIHYWAQGTPITCSLNRFLKISRSNTARVSRACATLMKLSSFKYLDQKHKWWALQDKVQIVETRWKELSSENTNHASKNVTHSRKLLFNIPALYLKAEIKWKNEGVMQPHLMQVAKSSVMTGRRSPWSCSSDAFEMHCARNPSLSYTSQNHSMLIISA